MALHGLWIGRESMIVTRKPMLNRVQKAEPVADDDPDFDDEVEEQALRGHRNRATLYPIRWLDRRLSDFWEDRAVFNAACRSGRAEGKAALAAARRARAAAREAGKQVDIAASCLDLTAENAQVNPR
jgi:hypothetical protein